MKLLVITQALDKNNSALAFFEKWLLAFSGQVDSLIVIAQKVGEHNLPNSVKVFSLGKEKGNSKFNQLRLFLRLIFSMSGEYDTVFVHMNPIYLALAGWYWGLKNKKVGLWYTHRNIDFKLRLANMFADKIFTASTEGFRLDSRKKVVLGHGIDVDNFNCSIKELNQPVKIIHIGRITPIKNCDVLIEVMAKLNSFGILAELKFVGEPIYEADKLYKKKLEELVVRLKLQDKVIFVGPIAYCNLPKVYCEGDLTVNLAPTGGMDKVVLESLSSGRPVFVSNLAFASLFGNYKDRFVFNEKSAIDLAEKIKSWIENPNQDIVDQLKTKVKENFSIIKLINRVVSELS